MNIEPINIIHQELTKALSDGLIVSWSIAYVEGKFAVVGSPEFDVRADTLDEVAAMTTRVIELIKQGA